jgi:Leucine-rich repeat (LRR) protein
MSDVTAADLDAIGQHLSGLQILTLEHASGPSLAALTPLTRLSSVGLACSQFSSIDPLTALTRLQYLHLCSCAQVTSLDALTALRSLRQLTLNGCPQLAAALPPSLQHLLLPHGCQ